MRIIFVRHGHPNYEKDCLTELGHRQAQAAAQRLSGETISRVHASSCGRAAETAGYIAAPRGLEVICHDFMRELSWGSVDNEPLTVDGHPWRIADDLIADNVDIMSPRWTELEAFRRNTVVAGVQQTTEQFDRWLAELGYEREGRYYRVRRSNEETVAMVSHGGSSSAVLAHLFNLTFPFFCATVHLDYTSVTIVSFEGKEGTLITPRAEIMNDFRHIAGV